MNFPPPLLPFDHPQVLQTALPLGGIGAGCVCLNGYGGVQDFALRHRPCVTGLPDRHNGRGTAFAALRVGGAKPIARLLEGPLPPEKIYNGALHAGGYRPCGHEGLPRFSKSRFRSGYPFGRVELTDPAVPLTVGITGWSPFVPLDDAASGLPCAMIEYTLRNPSRRAVDFEFSCHLGHPALSVDGNEAVTRNRVMRGKGVCLNNTLPAGAETSGSASLSVVGQTRPKAGGRSDWKPGSWRVPTHRRG